MRTLHTETLTTTVLEPRRLLRTRSAIRFLAVSTVVLAFAANAATGAPDRVDDEWRELRGRDVSLARPSSSGAKLGSAKLQKVDRDAAAAEAAQLVDLADQYRSFRKKHPDHGKVNEAKRREALALLQAGFRGEKTQSSRRKQLVDDIRKDRRIPATERLEVAGTSDNLEVATRQIAKPADLDLALEQVARSLIAEFPEQPAGYESLLNLAKSGSDERAQSIYSDLLKMPAPQSVKDRASRWLDRFSLQGERLSDLAKSAKGADPLPEQNDGCIVVVYTWSANDRGSIELAKEIGSIQMPKLEFWGVNLDGPESLAAARRQATELPGRQITLGQRCDAPIVRALLLDQPSLLYVTDRQGIVISVSAHNGPSRVIINASHR